jgi:hypothetical protein
MYGSQREHARNPRQGYPARTSGAEPRTQAGLPFPTAPERPSGEAGLGIPCAAQGDIRAWMFLALS